MGGDEGGEGFVFPFACVSEHTRFAEAIENYVMFMCDSNSLRLNGNQNFHCPLPMSFFPTMNINPANHRVQIWHFPRFI